MLLEEFLKPLGLTRVELDAFQVSKGDLRYSSWGCRMIRELCSAALIAFFASPTELAAAQDQEHALSMEREVERIAGERVFWPGFDPLAIPLAVYTGERTVLFRHPSPPEGFSQVRGNRPGTFALQGRHPSVTSNPSAEIGGTITATLLADGPRADRSPAELAATALHEAFHVYQRRRHPGWSGNEGDLFLYPTDDARLLGLRRLESAALRRALGAPDDPGAECWARLALGFRNRRFAGMDAVFSVYERLTELNEGLATYVQLLASGQTTVEIPETEFGTADIRERTYAIGPALAFLLDRFRPGWQAELEADDTQVLDRMLESALGVKEGPCALPGDEIAGIGQTAHEDVTAMIAARGERRRVFDARPGWRVVVLAAEGQPLWPQGFDPLNVERVEGGVLHTRFLNLGNDAGELRAIDEVGADIEALTDGVGPHPLFNGIRRVAVAGLGKPEIRAEGRQVTVSAPGFTARFQNARVEVNGTEVLVRLEPSR